MVLPRLWLPLLAAVGGSWGAFASPQASDAAPAVPAIHWTYEAVGPDAPKREHFVVRPDSTEWLDPHQRVLWRLQHSTGTLTLRDPDGGGWRVIDEAAVRAIRNDLARARSLGLLSGQSPGGPLPAGAALSMADRREAVGPAIEEGGLRCQRMTLFTGDQRVGEACVAPADALPGGRSLQLLLQRFVAVAEQVRADETPRRTTGQGHRAAPSVRAEWPVHPLIAASRWGGIPVSVSEEVPGERAHKWRLTGPPSAPMAQ